MSCIYSYTVSLHEFFRLCVIRAIGQSNQYYTAESVHT